MMGPGADRIINPLSRRIVAFMALFALAMACSCSGGSDPGPGTAGDGMHGNTSTVKKDGLLKSPAADKEPVPSSGVKTKIPVLPGADKQGVKEKKGITKPGTKGPGDMLEKPQVEMPRPQ